MYRKDRHGQPAATWHGLTMGRGTAGTRAVAKGEEKSGGGGRQSGESLERSAIAGQQLLTFERVRRQARRNEFSSEKRSGAVLVQRCTMLAFDPTGRLNTANTEKR
jgi:hypothetical protein